MAADLTDVPLEVLLAELRCRALVFDRYRAAMGHGTVKGIAVTQALAAVETHGGHVDRSEIWLLPSEHEVLGPWVPIREGVQA